MALYDVGFTLQVTEETNQEIQVTPTFGSTLYATRLLQDDG